MDRNRVIQFGVLFGLFAFLLGAIHFFLYSKESSHLALGTGFLISDQTSIAFPLIPLILIVTLLISVRLILRRYRRDKVFPRRLPLHIDAHIPRFITDE